ncbi:MAG: hypothetical protein ACYC00_20570 [Eubacteriales bacterium]
MYIVYNGIDLPNTELKNTYFKYEYFLSKMLLRNEYINYCAQYCDINFEFYDDINNTDFWNQWEDFVEDYISSLSNHDNDELYLLLVDEALATVEYKDKYIVITTHDIFKQMESSYNNFEGINEIIVLGNKLLITMSWASSQGGMTLIYDLDQLTLIQKIDSWITDNIYYIPQLGFVDIISYTAYMWVIEYITIIGDYSNCFVSIERNDRSKPDSKDNIFLSNQKYAKKVDEEYLKICFEFNNGYYSSHSIIIKYKENWYEIEFDYFRELLSEPEDTK